MTKRDELLSFAKEKAFDSHKNAALLALQGEYAARMSARVGGGIIVDASATSMLPLLATLWDAVPGAKNPNAPWSLIIADKPTFEAAVAKIQAATSIEQIQEVFPVAWPA